jgi:predicted kinase
MNKLIIIRGLPGSGKTTLAQTISLVHYEADQFFMQANGVYEYDKEKIKDAHEWCQKKTEYAMRHLVSPIVVSNTFVKRWEMQPYLDLATSYGYEVFEITMSGPLYPNVHGVPDEVIERMRTNWEK